MFNTPTIKSRDNAKLKFVRRVRDGQDPDHIFIEGYRLCGEAFDSRLSIVSCFLSESFRESRSFDTFEPILSSRHVESYVVSESLLGSIADTKSPQGIVLIAARPVPAPLIDLFSGGNIDGRLPVWLYLYKVNNPSNLGAVLRTAEAAGTRAVLISPSSADAFSPKSLRASMGSAFRMPVVSDIAFENLFSTAQQEEIDIVAVDAQGSVSYTDVDWKRPSLLVFGSEAEGLPPDALYRARVTIKIPMYGDVESLNLAVSTGIILFEAKRRNEVKG